LAFLTLLKKSGVEFIAVDNPHANKSTVHNLVAAARREHDIVSERAAAALKIAKARGKPLGNPKLSEARRRAIVVNMDRADCYLETLLPVIQEIQESGVKLHGALRGHWLRAVSRQLAAANGQQYR
jgi:DNA invertase Pin-like site-specific DNA recombinase